MHTHLRRSARFLCSLLLPSVLAVAQPPRKSTRPVPLHTRLLAAATFSTLGTEGVKPWHLKLNVTIFDVKGQNPVDGTIETWRTPPADRTEFIFGSSSRTVLHIGDKDYSAESGPALPALAGRVLEGFLDPGPSDGDIEGAHLDFRKQAFGKAQLECIMLSRPFTDGVIAPLGLFPTYCLRPGSNSLLARYDFGSLELLRNKMGLFQGREVSTDLTVEQDQIPVAEAKVAVLETFTPSPGLFQPKAAMKAEPANLVQVDGKVMAGLILKKVQPVYPTQARARSIDGPVVLHAIIGRDGHIRSLRTVTAPDPDLAITALTAARQWTYKPYLFNGEPAKVETTITINFDFGPGVEDMVPVDD